MREETVTYKVYKFEELSEEAKQKVLEKLWTLNVDYDWCEGVYDDAKRIGLTIQGFDIDRGSSIQVQWNEYEETVAKNILKEGYGGELKILAESFLKQWAQTSEENEKDEEVRENLSKDFNQQVEEEYLCMLRREYEYLTSEEAIVESIQANEYEFLEDGSIYR